MVDIKRMQNVRRNLDRFIKKFDDCVNTEPSRRHLRTYINGQVSGLERKSVEPIALQADVPVRSLQEFLGFHRWDHQLVREKVREIVIRDHASDNAIAVIDETSVAKKGKHTVGVQSQHCGSTGKIDNCVVTVHLGYAAANFHTMLDAELFLPEYTWATDEKLRREAKIPDDVVYRPKWKIALDQLTDAVENGVKFKWVVADELYGGTRDFRNGVDKLGLTYVVEIPRRVMGWTRMPEVEIPARNGVTGRPRTKPRLAPNQPKPRRVDELWRRGGPSWETYHIKDTEKGPLVWEARHSRFVVSHDELPTEDIRLIAARNVLTGEVKYFLSNAPESAPVSELLRIAFSRWRIERIFEDAKGNVGLDHFEARRWLAVTRHLILTMISILFLARETRKLREKKTRIGASAKCGKWWKRSLMKASRKAKSPVV